MDSEFLFILSQMLYLMETSKKKGKSRDNRTGKRISITKLETTY